MSNDQEKISIITEDSGVKLPPIDERKDKIGRGRHLEEIEGLTEILENEGLDIPSEDLELEERYKKILTDFVRPAILMFSGMFREVRSFKRKIEKEYNSELYIISGRYGLVNEDEEIVPYDAYMETQEDLKKLDEKCNFSNDMKEVVENSSLTFLFAATRYLEYLLSIDWFEDINGEIWLVTGKRFAENFTDHANVNVLKKRGVARISWQNREKIMELLGGGVLIH